MKIDMPADQPPVGGVARGVGGSIGRDAGVRSVAADVYRAAYAAT